MSILGLVLAGGAARGAYSAGVMRYLFQELPRNLGHVPWPDVVTGTSVGALNGVFAAARDSRQLRAMTRTWQRMTVDQVYRVESGGLIRTLRATWAAATGAALLDSSPLRATVRRQAPLGALRQAVDSGETRCFIVSATQVATGINVLFVDSSLPDSLPDLGLDPLPGARVKRVQLSHEHLMASAALPFAFHPVDIDGAWYVDGGLRQNTPLRPAIMAGADRVLVVGTTAEQEHPDHSTHPHLTPNLPFLAGKTLNALMADPVERDLRTTQRINAIISWGSRTWGPDFATRLEQDLGIRQVTPLFLRPSADLGVLAAQCWRHHRPKLPAQVAWLLSTMSDRANAIDGESDLLSYLLFDRAFTAEAERIGFEDARAREDELAAFVDGSN